MKQSNYLDYTENVFFLPILGGYDFFPFSFVLKGIFAENPGHIILLCILKGVHLCAFLVVEFLCVFVCSSETGSKLCVKF